jgi:phosphate-selective porin OprO and OprP
VLHDLVVRNARSIRFSAFLRKQGRVVFLSVAVAFACSSAAASQTPEPDPQPPKKDSTKKDDRRDWGFRWDDHPSLFFSKDTHIDLRARVQTHVRESEAPLGDASAFDVARRRIGLEGRIAGIVDFQIEGEIGSSTPWRDVFADYRQFDALRVMAGQFKIPFSLDENTGSTNLDFVYRSRAATQLAPGRDRGVMLHGRLLRRSLEYEAGVFRHDGENARTRKAALVHGRETVAGRVTVLPFVRSGSIVSDLQFAVAATGSDVPEGISALRGRTALDAPFFPADYYVRGRRLRTGLEMRWRPGPFSIKSEYMRVSTERLGQSVGDTDLSPLVGEGWYVSGTWIVTGEKKSRGLEAPRRSLLRRGVGALELAARVEKLRFHSTASGDIPSPSPRADVVLPNSDRAVTFGFNWVPLRGIKIQGNVIREVIADPSSGPLPTQPGFWSKVLRFQFTL